jgi:hypothetical protein
MNIDQWRTEHATPVRTNTVLKLWRWFASVLHVPLVPVLPTSQQARRRSWNRWSAHITRQAKVTYRVNSNKVPRCEKHGFIEPLEEGRDRSSSSALQTGERLIDIGGGATLRVDVLRDRLRLSDDAGQRLARRGRMPMQR